MSTPLPRSIEAPVEADLAEKMVFVSGPRQCGKTTLAENLLGRRPGAYFSWDDDRDRAALRRRELPHDKRLWVFDELHKFHGWRNWLKGLYDSHRKGHEFLVTGSARLDLFRRGGDSLQGRYFHHRLHPLTLGEVLRKGGSVGAGVPWLAAPPAPRGAPGALGQLLRLGGFPEPFLKGSDVFAARWRLGYGSRLVRDDIRDLEPLLKLEKLELLWDRLPSTVGSVLSLNALREDLEVNFDSVRRWVRVLESVYGVFRVAPWGPPRIRAVRKEQKLYLWDWAAVPGEAARFENLIAVHLLRYCHWLEDTAGRRAELRYLRDRLGREADFVVLVDGKPEVLIEAKLSAQGLDPSLRYFAQRVRVPAVLQVHRDGERDLTGEPIEGAQVRLCPASRLLCALP